MKAILPVAGLGTRLMPLTVHQPKALVGIADKPMVYYALEEARVLGADEVIFVISPHQLQLKQYLKSLSMNRRVHFAVQEEQLGNADAIFKAKPFLRNEPASVFFCDDILVPGIPIMREAINLSRKTASPALILEPVPKFLVSQYGVVKIKKSIKGRFAGCSAAYEIQDIIEKPLATEAPSNLGVIGRYVLTPEIFKAIQKLYPANHRKLDSEIGITDALRLHLQSGGKVYGLVFDGHRFDCGSKIGLLKAHAYFSVNHKEFGKELRGYIKTLI